MTLINAKKKHKLIGLTIMLFLKLQVLQQECNPELLTVYSTITHVGTPQMKGKQDVIDVAAFSLSIIPTAEANVSAQPSKLRASVKVSFSPLMSGNDERCVLRKALPVRAAQTVLSNGMFSEESPASPHCVHCELNCG